MDTQWVVKLLKSWRSLTDELNNYKESYAGEEYTPVKLILEKVVPIRLMILMSTNTYE